MNSDSQVLMWKEHLTKYEKGEDSSFDDVTTSHHFYIPKSTKTIGHFRLNIDSRSFTDSEIFVLIGENGIGKTTFLNVISGMLESDSGYGRLRTLTPTGNCAGRLSMMCQGDGELLPGDWTARSAPLLCNTNTKGFFHSKEFMAEIYNPLGIDKIIDREIQTLSSGELQKLMIAATLAMPADTYLLDEPSVHLGLDERLTVARAIRNFIMRNKKTAFIVEHDPTMAFSLADRIIFFTGQPGGECYAKSTSSRKARYSKNDKGGT